MRSNPNDISITILEKGTDIENSLPVMLREEVNKKHWTRWLRNISRVILVIIFLLSAAAAVLYVIEGSVGVALAYILNALLFLYFLLMIRSEKKRKIIGMENARKIRVLSYPDGYYPITYNFTDGGISKINSGNRSSTDYRAVNHITESAEGIYISLAAPLTALNIWLPARFISKDDYDRLSCMLREKAGKRKYTVLSQLNTPEKAETVQQEAETIPLGEKRMEFSFKYSKSDIVKGMFGNLVRRSKRALIMLPLLIIAFLFSGFLRDILGTGKLIVKIARLVAKYTELGQVISQADIIDTFQSLIITVMGLLVSACILIHIVLYAYIIIYNVVYIAREYIVSKPILDEGNKFTIYDFCIEEKNGEKAYCIMLWNKVQKAEIIKKRLVIRGNRGKKYMIPLGSIKKEQKTQIFEFLNYYLGKDWKRQPAAALTQSQSAKFEASTYSADDQ